MKVVVVRSTSIFKDSRTSKLITELLSLGVDVTVLGWDRLNEYKETEEFKNNIERTLQTVIFAVPKNRGFLLDRYYIHLTPEISEKIKVIEE